MATTKKATKPAKKTAAEKSAPAKKTKAPAKSKKTKTIASRAGTTAERAAKKSAGTPKKASAKKAPAKRVPASAAKKKTRTVSPAPAAAENPGVGLGLVRRCVAALEEKKAVGIEVIFLGESSPVTDYCVIATGTSDPHLRALRIELEKAIREAVPDARVRVQNEPNSGWCVVDAFDVVVHIFSEDQRRNYALEELWKNGERVAL